MMVTTIAIGFAAFRLPVDRRVFAPTFDLRSRPGKALRRLWLVTISLPDRGAGANGDELPCEYFRFPPF